MPDDIRNFFKDGKLRRAIVLLHVSNVSTVAPGPKGAYMDTSDTKKPRLKCVKYLCPC
jgi:predicted transcriptional regulator